MANEVITTQPKTEIQVLKTMLSSDSVKKRFNEILGKKAPGFISSILALANSNTNFANCDAKSVLNGAAIAASLDLPVNQSLGYCGIIPYNDRKTGKCVAQFQIMTNGLKELCFRTGMVHKLVYEPVREGELVKKNKFKGEYEFDEDARVSDKIIGYMAYFKLTTGMEKTEYMTVEEINAHAKKYSQGYRMGASIWKDNFDGMALKTVLKKLMKSMPKSINYQLMQAAEFDQSTIKGDFAENGIEELAPEYIDNPSEREQRMANVQEILDAKDVEEVG